MPEYMPTVHPIVMEASSKEDKQFMKNMSKNDIHQINGNLIQNLYASVIKRKDIDFGDIPASKGDIEKLKFYKETVESVETLEKLYTQNNIDEPSIGDVKRAISNMKKFRPQFIAGFKIGQEFVEMTYNSLTMSILDATSMLISSYMTYIVGGNSNYRITGEVDRNRGVVSLENLQRFNIASDNGNMSQALAFVLNEKKKAFMGEEFVIGGVVILALLSIVPLLREIIYFFYFSKIKISDYLAMQADFLEMNKLAVEASSKSPTERKAIIKKQENVIKRMRKISDKLMINNVDSNDVAKKELKQENSLWSLTNIEKSIASNKMATGTSLNIV